MNGNYLIPANTKRGQLILGLFQPIDLIIVGAGLALTLLLIVILPIDDSVWFAVAAISPGLVAGFLALPVAHYHNVRQLLTEIIKYFKNRKRYLWKGWCFLDESQYSESKSKFKN